MEKCSPRLGNDFHAHKRVCEEIAVIPSQELCNEVAGCVTPLTKWVQRGPGGGVSIKPQEEETERRENYVPEAQPWVRRPLELILTDQ